MKRFELLRPDGLGTASQALLDDERAVARGAGIDLLDHLKAGLSEPSALVELRRIPGEAGETLRGIAVRSDDPAHIELGSLVTLSQLAEAETLAGPHAALRRAASEAATPSIRNMATLGGNLLQRPRCWYYRDPELRCLKKGGDMCLAIGGDSRYHAILGGGPSWAVHPSSLGAALVALNARVRIHGVGTTTDGVRELPIEELFAPPSEDPKREHRLARGEILTAVLLPKAAGDHRSAYRAAREKQSHDWPLAEAAVSLEMVQGKMTKVRVGLGHVAPIPWRATEAEAVLEGRAPSTDLFAEAAEAALAPASALAGNAYKIPLTRGLIRHVLHEASGVPTPA